MEFTGPFREICKCRSSSLSIENVISLMTLIRKLSSTFGEVFERRLGLKEDGYDEEAAMVILNGVVVGSSNLKNTIVKPGDRIVFAPSLASGG